MAGLAQDNKNQIKGSVRTEERSNSVKKDDYSDMKIPEVSEKKVSIEFEKDKSGKSTFKMSEPLNLEKLKQEGEKVQGSKISELSANSLILGNSKIHNKNELSKDPIVSKIVKDAEKLKIFGGTEDSYQKKQAIKDQFSEKMRNIGKEALKAGARSPESNEITESIIEKLKNHPGLSK